jgi:hypothetical protein
MTNDDNKIRCDLSHRSGGRNMKRLVCSIAVMCLSSAWLLASDTQPTLDSAEKKAVIDALCDNLESEYIFADITEEYVRTLRQNLRLGKYDGTEQPEEFARLINQDLEAVHEDRHLYVRFDPEWVENERGRKALDDEAVRLGEWRERTTNYGFREVEILPGNIGYLKFDSFSYDPGAYEPAIGAMSFLSNTAALIIDLRDNGGGSPEMVQFLCSYFLDNPRKHLNSFSYRDPEKLTQYWTYTYLPGRRLDQIDLYLLTSRRTFSAAEEFVYNLKNMKRATIVGEATGGGAHDNRFVILSDGFMMSLPFARAVNPVTRANWEGIGVEPDVEVAREAALETALAMASTRLAEREDDQHRQSYYRWFRESYRAARSPVTLDDERQRSYVGTYGPRTVTLEDGVLFYQREDRPRLKMVPMGEGWFGLEGIDFFRLRFLEEGDRVVAVEGRDPNGVTDTHARDD